jgi:hypothetical protein
MTSHNAPRRIRPAIILSSAATVLLLVAVSYVYLLLAGRIHGSDWFVQGMPPVNDSLLVHGYLPKNTFSEGEDIPLKIYLVNCSKRVLCVVRDYILNLQYVKIECRDEFGDLCKQYDSGLRLTLRYPFSCDSLAPGDSAAATQNLRLLYGSPQYPLSNRSVHPIGRFTVQAVYEKGTFSNEIQYQVK